MNAINIEKSWYWDLIIKCPTNLFELVSYYLFEEGASGIEELRQGANNIQARVYFPSDVDDPQELCQVITVSHNLISGSIEIVSREKKKFENWNESWKAYFKPLTIGQSFIVRPPWEKSQTGKREIIINPGLGFGTGYHESTSIAIQLFEWASDNIDMREVVDVGTGSGILTIAAFLLGANQVTAIDIDEEALKEVPNNLELSGLSLKNCTIVKAEPKELDKSYDIVIANIEGYFLKTMAKELNQLTKPGGFLILSGILEKDQNEFKTDFQSQMALRRELQINEWYGLVLQK